MTVKSATTSTDRRPGRKDVAAGHRPAASRQAEGLACVAAATALATALLAATAVRAQSEDDRLRSLGKRLSAECTACHRPDAPGGSIPSITGWDVDEFLTTLQFYASGERKHQVMMSVAQSLDERQARALALYFASLPRMKGNRDPATAPKKK